MRISSLNEQQRRAMLDLVVLATYLDGNLATVEDARVHGLLTAMGFQTSYDRSREFDAAVTRVRPQAETPEVARSHAASLAAHFTTAEQRRFVLMTLDDLVSADGGVSAEETRFLATIKQVLTT